MLLWWFHTVTFLFKMHCDLHIFEILIQRRIVCQFPGHQGAVQGLTVSTDGSILVSCGSDCTVRLWNVPDATLADLDNLSDNSAKFMFGRMHFGKDHDLLESIFVLLAFSPYGNIS
ncbi:uncharacterized protein LOC111309294 isoform X2 [Durio zibethinus]|uniref:Uncharacterized protein LOC111309294 isoform X2 n=1 Tax=Durio zibethinus TaxID=66656 RepID=A0A6P6AGR9_DURZI|nr:uncharacterized protein LOC111309294 isoform X2 [Durio zibethinus]